MVQLKKCCSQVNSDLTHIFCHFLSAYYPAFRSMFRNVVAALNEAQDIALHLKPLTGMFQVKVSS